MRRLVGLLVAVPLLLGCAPTSTAQGNASCAGPVLDDRAPDASDGALPPTVRPGEDLRIYGHWYTSTCNDTSNDHAPLEPLPDVGLTLRLPDGDTVALGAFTPAGPDSGFTVPVHVPATAPPGQAVVSDDLDHAYRFSITRPASR